MVEASAIDALPFVRGWPHRARPQRGSWAVLALEVGIQKHSERIPLIEGGPRPNIPKTAGQGVVSSLLVVRRRKPVGPGSTCAQRSAVTLMRPGVGDYLQAAFLAASLVTPAFVVAVLWILPVGELGADRIAMAARDYTDMWAAGHLVALGQGDALYSIWLRSMPRCGPCSRVIPAPGLALSAADPAARRPALDAPAAGWVLALHSGTLALLWPALRSGGLPVAACAAVLFSPAVADNALTGQTGGLTAALLSAACRWCAAAPSLAARSSGACSSSRSSRCWSRSASLPRAIGARFSPWRPRHACWPRCRAYCSASMPGLDFS